MKNTRLLVLSIGLSLGVEGALGQFDFAMTAGLVELTETGGYELRFFAENQHSAGLPVDGSNFTIQIGELADTSPKPFFVIDEVKVMEGTVYEPIYPILGLYPDDSTTPAQIYLTVDLFDTAQEYWPVFRPNTPERVMTVGVSVPQGLTSGTWSLRYINDTYTYLGGGLDSDLGRDYVLRFTDYRLTLINGDLELVPVPEPSQFALVGGLALLGFAGWRRSRK